MQIGRHSILIKSMSNIGAIKGDYSLIKMKLVGRFLISNMNHGLIAIDSIRTYQIELGERIEISLGKPLKAIQ